MRAWIYQRYGGPEELTLTDVPQPQPGPSELLVQVAATALNAADWHMLRGDPLMVRAVTGIGFAPRRRRIIGSDISGVVTAVGSNVQDFTIGDRVHAEVDDGGAAEYVAIPMTAAAHAPEKLSMAESAAVGMAAITALKAVREGAKVGNGDRVLVNGASGGVGTFAVQLALAFGAEVTAVTSARNKALLVDLGAHNVIAYDQQDFTTTETSMDVLIDIVGDRSLRTLRAAMSKRGRVILVGGENGGRFLGPASRMLGATFLNPFASQRLHPVVDSKPSGDDLRTIDALIEHGTVQPVIDEVFPFMEVPAAVARLETRRARGKIVIEVDNNL